MTILFVKLLSYETIVFLTYISIFFMVSSLVLGSISYTKLDTLYRIFLLYIFFTLTILTASIILPKYYPNNLPLLHISTIGEYTILSIFFYKLRLKNLFKKDITAIVFFSVIIALLISNSLFWSSIFEFNNFPKAIVQFIFIAYSFQYFYSVLNKGIIKEEKSAKSINLIVTSILIYNAGSIFIFLFANYNKHLTAAENYIVWIINAFLTILFNAIIFIAICFHLFKNKKSSI